ncbi:MAG: DUF1285 domain-containing protein [Magnetovibrionaceae bacterium]
MSTTPPSDPLKDVPADIASVKGRIRNICGDLAMRIDEDGQWYHEGAPIGRIELVRLFATVLKRDDHGNYWLATPVEAGRIQVDDAPFVAVEAIFGSSGDEPVVSFRSNLDDVVTLDDEHPLRISERPGVSGTEPEPRPYIHWRDGLEARIARAVFYDLVAHAVEEQVGDETFLGLWSAGTFFPLGKMPQETLGNTA